jgi:hypothetical protein
MYRGYIGSVEHLINGWYVISIRSDVHQNRVAAETGFLARNKLYREVGGRGVPLSLSTESTPTVLHRYITCYGMIYYYFFW